MLTYLLFSLGLLMLVFGGDWLVKGAVAIAERSGIPPLVIGLTIVAFGTSAPELVISLKAALTNQGGIAVGNVVGSNIANVLLVLGVPALFSTITGSEKGMKTTLSFLIAVTIMFMVMMYYGPINRSDGLMLLVALGLFLSLQFNAARRHQHEVDDYHDELGEIPTSMGVILSYLIGGLVLLPIGASIAVDSAADIARAWNVSEEVIGLTIVAIGTSLPELVTGIMAARHNNTSVAVGNIIGSNLFNIAAIMGVTATVVDVPVGTHILSFDMWVMLFTTILLIALPIFHLELRRMAGLVLTGSYVAYLVITAAF